MSIIKLAVESGTGLRCMEYGILYGAGGWCGHTDDNIVLTGTSFEWPLVVDDGDEQSGQITWQPIVKAGHRV